MVKVSGGGKDSKGILQPVPKVPEVGCCCLSSKRARNDKGTGAVVAAGCGEFGGSGSFSHDSLLRGYGLRGGDLVLGSIIACGREDASSL